MKKITFLLVMLLMATMSAQEISSLTSDHSYYSTIDLTAVNIPVSDIENRIDYLISFLHDEEYDIDPEEYFGDMSIYYSARVVSHTQLYTYYNSICDTEKMTLHKNYLFEYLIKLLKEQCVGSDYYYRKTTGCTTTHGGFISPVNTGGIANPKVTAEAILAFMSAKNFYEKTHFEPPVSVCELEERIEKAKQAMLNYNLFNDHFTNLTAFGFTASAALHDYYNDSDSYDFLNDKGDELLNGLPPLKSTANNPIEWYLDWDEGQQADGSWKVFGWDGTTDFFPSDLCLRWHDSEAVYHAVMIEGMAELFRSLDGAISSSLKTKAKTALIHSINHIIDYNGVTGSIENPFNDRLTYITAYKYTRLSNSGILSKYHREVDDSYTCVPLNDSNGNPSQLQVGGYVYIRSLIKAKKSLEGHISSADMQIIEQLIEGLTKYIVVTLSAPQSEAMSQLVDLSFYLNKENFYNDYQIENAQIEEVVISFDDDNIHRYKEDTSSVIANYDTFYTGTQHTQKMVSGDFDGDGNDETLVAFEQGSIYRFHEDTSGLYNEVPGDAFFDANVETEIFKDMIVGDFNGDGIDEAVIAFADGTNRPVYRFQENSSGKLSKVSSTPFYAGTQDVQQMAVGDFNGNGKDEVIIAFDGGFTNKLIYRYEENSNGILDEVGMHFHSSTDLVQDMAVGDFNCDSKDELIIAFDSGLIYRYHVNSSSQLVVNGSSAFYQGGQITQNITVGDYNGDGKDEAIISFDGGYSQKLIYRFHEDANGDFEEISAFYNGTQLTEKMVSGDFNNDGKDEAIIVFEQGSIQRFEENTSGFMDEIGSAFYTGGTGVPKVQNISVRSMYACTPTTASRATNTAEATQFDPISNENTFTIYKADDTYVINTTFDDNSTVEIFDIYGRKILKENFIKRTSVSKASLVSGLNIMILTNDSTKKVIKLVN